MNSNSETFHGASNITQVKHLDPVHPFVRATLKYQDNSELDPKKNTAVADDREPALGKGPVRVFVDTTEPADQPDVMIGSVELSHDIVGPELIHKLNVFPAASAQRLIVRAKRTDGEPRLLCPHDSEGIGANTFLGEYAGELVSVRHSPRALESMNELTQMIIFRFRGHTLGIDGHQPPPANMVGEKRQAAASASSSAAAASSSVHADEEAPEHPLYGTGNYARFNEPSNARVYIVNRPAQSISTRSWKGTTPSESVKQKDFPINRALHYPRAIIVTTRDIEPGEEIRLGNSHLVENDERATERLAAIEKIIRADRTQLNLHVTEPRRKGAMGKETPRSDRPGAPVETAEEHAQQPTHIISMSSASGEPNVRSSVTARPSGLIASLDSDITTNTIRAPRDDARVTRSQAANAPYRLRLVNEHALAPQSNIPVHTLNASRRPDASNQARPQRERAAGDERAVVAENAAATASAPAAHASPHRRPAVDANQAPDDTGVAPMED